jgi:hypothetical protein
MGRPVSRYLYISVFIHICSPEYRFQGGVPPPSPISAKKPFGFIGIQNFLRRSYLILRELYCRYVTALELRAFWDGSGGDLGLRAFLTRPLILIVRQTEN